MLEVAKSGSQVFRVPINNDWAGDDALMEAAALNGVTIHAGLGGGGPLPGAAGMPEWLSWVSTAVQKYGYGGSFWKEHPSLPYKPITAWEIWNEPDLFGNTGAEFGQFVSDNANAIQSASNSTGGRGTEVISGGLNVWGNKNAYEEDLKYMEAAYPKFATNPNVTGVAIHPYELDTNSFFSPSYTRLEAFKFAVAGFHYKLVELAAAAKSAQKPLWITEAGWPSGGPQYGVSDAEQANLLTQTIDYAKNNQGTLNLGGYIWYNYRDRSGTSVWDDFCGLRDRYGNYRSAWWAFQREMGATPWPGPHVETGGPSSIGESQAVANGVVDAHGNPSTYYFEYGLTSGEYDRVTSSGSLSSEGNTPVSATISGLQAGTVYHYRLVASSGESTTYGEDRTATTVGYRYMRGLSDGSAVSSWAQMAGQGLPSDSLSGDFDGDGKADVLELEWEKGDKYRYRVGYSSGSGISSWKTVISGMGLPTALGFADFTGDGKADIVAVEPNGSGKYRYMLGKSSGTAISSWTEILSGMSLSSKMALGDFTGDGKADIVAVEPNGGKYRYMLGKSNGTATSSWTEILSGMGVANFMSVADLNGDAKFDILALEAEGGSNRYRAGFSNGSSVSWQTIQTWMVYPQKSSLGDFDGDGKADIVALEPEGGGKYQYRVGFSAGSSGVSKLSTVLSGMSPASQFAVGDFNGDGKADVVAVESEGNGKYRYMRGLSNGSSISGWSQILGGMSLPTSFDLGDFNGDGKADIIAYEAEGSGKYRIMRGLSNGSGVSSWGQALGGLGSPQKVAVGDVTGDGKADVVSVESQGGGQYRYMLGKSNGTGITSWGQVLGNMAYSEFLDVADFSGDGKADIVSVESQGGGQFRFMLGTSNGTGIASWSQAMGGMSGPYFFNVGDVDGDGKADVVSLEKVS